MIYLGIRGQITNSTNDNAVIPNASIDIHGRDAILTLSHTGHYYYILPAGNYVVTVKAEGFDPLTRHVLVTNGGISQLDFALHSQVLEMEYHQYSKLETLLHQIEKQYSSIVQLYSIGESVGGQTLWTLKIGLKNRERETSPVKIKFIAGVHGNDKVNTELLLQLVETLCKNYGQDYTITELINNAEINVMPLMNPDGAALSQMDGCLSDEGRLNQNQVDLDVGFTQSNTEPLQPEALAVANWVEEDQFMLSIVLESEGLLVEYPPASINNKSQPVHPFAKYYGDKYYEGTHLIWSDIDACAPGINKSKATNSVMAANDFNPRNNSMQDWNTYHGCLELTVHTSCCGQLPLPEVVSLWNTHRHSLISSIKQVLTGIELTCIDSITKLGATQDARVYISRINNTTPLVRLPLIHVYGPNDVEPKPGMYRTLLPSGQYNLTVSTPGYLNHQQLVDVIDSVHKLTEVKIHLIQDTSIFGLPKALVAAISVILMVMIVICVLAAVCYQIRRKRYKNYKVGFHRIGNAEETFLSENFDGLPTVKKGNSTNGKSYYMQAFGAKPGNMGGLTGAKMSHFVYQDSPADSENDSEHNLFIKPYHDSKNTDSEDDDFTI